MAIEAVFNSWNNRRAQEYRRREGIDDALGTAVNVQTMVFGNKGDDSGTGVAFTRDPATGQARRLRRLPDQRARRGRRRRYPHARAALGAAEARPEGVRRARSAIMAQLEKHYRDMCDIEFTVEQRKLWMLQTRVGKRTPPAAVRIAVDMANEKLINRTEAIGRVTPEQLDQLLHPQFDPNATSTCSRRASTPRRAPPSARSSSTPTRRSSGSRQRREGRPRPRRDQPGRRPRHVRGRGDPHGARRQDVARGRRRARRRQAVRRRRRCAADRLQVASRSARTARRSSRATSSRSTARPARSSPAR